MLEFRYDTQLLIEGENLDEDKINEYLQNENLNEEQMQKLNELRELVGNCKLV